LNTGAQVASPIIRLPRTFGPSHRALPVAHYRLCRATWLARFPPVVRPWSFACGRLARRSDCLPGSLRSAVPRLDTSPDAPPGPTGHVPRGSRPGFPTSLACLPVAAVTLPCPSCFPPTGRADGTRSRLVSHCGCP